MPTPLPIRNRPIKVAVAGLGQISELVLPTYANRDDVEVVAIGDPDAGRVARWEATFPTAVAATRVDELLTVDCDVVDVLVPTPLHGEVGLQVLAAGRHLHMQKPFARDLDAADRMLTAAAASGATIRIMEDYLFYPPLRRLRDLIADDAIGTPVGVHMKIVATGRGGWEVPASSYRWQFEQSKDGRGMLVFDHGWHQLAVADWLFGPITRIFGWIGQTPLGPVAPQGWTLDAPSTLVWEHATGVRGVLDIHLAPETYFRSEYYGGDERVEVTGRAGYVRCNRISACGIQEPSVVVYRDGHTTSFHDIEDRPPAAFVASTNHWLDHLRGSEAPLEMDGPTGRRVLNTLAAALESAKSGHAVDIDPRAQGVHT